MEGFTVDVPDEAARAAAAAELDEIEGVERHGPMDARGDVAMIGEWVQVAGGALTVASTAFTLLSSVVDRLRRRGVMSAKLQVPGGVTIDVDSATPEQLRQLANDLGGKG